uniref:Tachykinin-related peptide transcript a n=1 Tax=Carabus violaceus TaxID=41075 RepID=A0A7U3RBK6_CARVO|nr:tachykinin-related peptide transcript a [Carabus violaceus]
MSKSRLVFPVLVAMLGATLASDSVRRVPSGFQGVRGKKSIQDTYPGDSVIADTGADVALEKRIPSAGFHGMRGKKLYPERNELPSDLSKRAPMGFMGMRGKKEQEYVGEDLDKRAPMGFMGMRGKKEYEDEYDEAALMNNDFYMDKRAPMGFMGMRGKKEYAPVMMEDEKRAPVSGFFGMRGKKQPGKSAFFGMRGKKFPYELRGKFVGVRGKKQSNENAIPEPEATETEDEGNTYQLTDHELDELLFVVLEQQQQIQQLQDERDSLLVWQQRQANGPSGYLGMRG